MYLERPLKEYLDDLAARKPAPGGGSAAALAASTGTGLMLMVANYTVGNPKYKNVEEKAADILVKAGRLKDEFERLIDEDVEAYTRLSKAIKEFKNDPEKLDASYKDAVEPPLNICRKAHECLALCAELVGCGNKNLITDIAIAAILLEGAFFSAKFNVYINLKYIKDLAFVEKIHNILSPFEDLVPKLREDIVERCEDVISK